MSENEVLLELDFAALAVLVADIEIPPRPSLFADMRAEVQRDEPRTRVMAEIAGSDVAMSAALMKCANAAWMGLSRRAETVQEAIALLGPARLHTIMTEVTLRDLFPSDGTVLTRYWDVSTKRALTMTYLARQLTVSSVALTHTFALFVDIGIPVLMKRFRSGPADYLETLSLSNASLTTCTDVEQARHKTDHAIVGSLLARRWNVSQTIQLAIRTHHDCRQWVDPLPRSVQELVALCLVAEHIIHRYEGLNQHAEWSRGGAMALQILGLYAEDLDHWGDAVHDLFQAQA